MSVMDENSKQAQRKAAMAVLAHCDAADIARCLDALALPAQLTCTPGPRIPRPRRSRRPDGRACGFSTGRA